MDGTSWLVSPKKPSLQRYRIKSRKNPWISWTLQSSPPLSSKREARGNSKKPPGSLRPLKPRSRSPLRTLDSRTKQSLTSSRGKSRRMMRTCILPHLISLKSRRSRECRRAKSSEKFKLSRPSRGTWQRREGKWS